MEQCPSGSRCDSSSITSRYLPVVFVERDEQAKVIVLAWDVARILGSVKRRVRGGVWGREEEVTPEELVPDGGR
jgi:hypothetical protein